MVEGFLIRPNGQIFNLETVVTESKDMSNTVTSHPVEGGSSISDHIVLKNKTFSVDVIISDATFADDNVGVQVAKVDVGVIDFITDNVGFVSQFLPPPAKPVIININQERDVAAEGRRLMEEIRDARELLTLETSIGAVENVVITSVRSSRDKDVSRFTYKFTLGLEQIQIVEQSAKVTIDKTKPEIKDGATDKTEAGRQSKEDVGESLLYKFNFTEGLAQ